MICAGADIRAGLIRAADKVLLYDMSGRSRTGQEVLENVDRLAGALVDRGYTGKRIGLWYQNSFAAVEAFLAVEWIGGTRVPVDPGAPLAEAEAVFQSAGVVAVLAGENKAAALPRSVLIHGDEKPLQGPSAWPSLEVDPENTLLLFPRAVTNGRLFAIPVSYGNWRATMESNISLLRSGRVGPWLGENECFLAAQQIMHGTGFVGTFPFIEMGLPQVLSREWDAMKVLAAVERHRITTTVLVGPMLSRLTHAAASRKQAADSLRHVMYGGGVVRPEEIRRSMQYLGPVLIQGYGRIEGGWPLTVLDLEDHRAIAEGDDMLAASCGRPIEGVSLKLRPVDGAGADRGELCVSSKMTSREYCSPDGWCSLGDLVRKDDRGYLYYEGRLDRMINTGYHIYPDEVEETIRRISGVAATRVVGESNGGLESMVAYLVPANGEAQDQLVQSVRTELARRLARYKIPSQFRIVKTLPERSMR